MQFDKTWNASFDQIFKAESLLQKNNQIFQRPTTYQSSRKQHSVGKSIYSRVYELEQLIRMIKEKKYNSKSELLSLDSLQQMDHVCIKKYRESIYFGQFINNCREGLGIMLYTNGRIYEGNWFNNYKHGKGYEKYINGTEYSGAYKEGKPSGYGRYSWDNGQTYEGQWEDGMKNGSGIWRGPSGDSYIGEWKDGKANGYGVHTWINGDRYEGEFKDCLKHGEGIQKFSNGDSYKGAYYEGRPEGYGQYYWAMGSFFKGTFKNGLREGQGVWKSGPGNSDKYEGQYKEDKKHGYGVFVWSNGNIYKGQFEDDLKEGYGQMIWSDGRCYKGNWHKGMQVHSQGQQIQFNEDNIDFEEMNNFEPDMINPEINKGIEISEFPQRNFSRGHERSCPLANPRNMIGTKRTGVKAQQNFCRDLNDFSYGDFEYNQPEYNDYYEKKPDLYSRKASKTNPYLVQTQYVQQTNNSPNCPIVYLQDNKKFRLRGSSKKSSRQINPNPHKNNQKEFKRNNPDKSSFLDNNYIDLQHNKSSRKSLPRKKNSSDFESFQNQSVKLRNNSSSQSYKKNTRNYNVVSSQSGRNASEKMMASSSFFLYKIHGKNIDKNDHSKNKRVVKTSGGTRSKRINQNIHFNDCFAGK